MRGVDTESLTELGAALCRDVRALLVESMAVWDPPTLIVFTREAYDELRRAVEKLGRPRVSVEYDSYRGVRIPIYMLEAVEELGRFGKLTLYRFRREHLLIIKCLAERCEEEPGILKIVGDGVEWMRLVDDATRLTEEEFRRGSNMVPLYELYRALSAIDRKLGGAIPPSILRILVERSLEYIEVLIEKPHATF